MALSNLPPASNLTGIGALLSLTCRTAVKILFFQLAEDLGDIFARKTGEQVMPAIARDYDTQPCFYRFLAVPASRQSYPPMDPSS